MLGKAWSWFWEFREQVTNFVNPQLPYLRLICQSCISPIEDIYSITGNYLEVYRRPKSTIMTIFDRSPGVEAGK